MSDIESLRTSALASVEAAASTAELEELRVQLLGKKGAVTGLLKGLGALSPEERPAAGAEINQLKEVIGEALSQRKDALGAAEAWREQKRVQLMSLAWPRGPARRHAPSLSCVAAYRGVLHKRWL